MTSPEKIWTAGLIVIGDEILSGRTQDKNIAQVASWLQVQGIRLAEVRVVPDVEGRIVAAVHDLSADYDYLFTTGGIGPTHDDITVDAVAAALGVPVVINPEARALLERYYETRGGLNEGRLRMALFLMAGVPHITAGMLDALTGQLEGGAPLLTETIGCWVAESEVAELLRAVEAAHETCQIGSYPFFREGRVGANFVVRSVSADDLRCCCDSLLEALATQGHAVTPGGI
jgi:molybdenum cofactor synthesis domain-containing protein